MLINITRKTDNYIVRQINIIGSVQFKQPTFDITQYFDAVEKKAANIYALAINKPGGQVRIDAFCVYTTQQVCYDIADKYKGIDELENSTLLNSKDFCQVIIKTVYTLARRMDNSMRGAGLRLIKLIRDEHGYVLLTPEVTRIREYYAANGFRPTLMWDVSTSDKPYRVMCLNSQVG